MEINFDLHLQDLENKINSFWQLSGEKILAIKQHFDPSLGTLYHQGLDGMDARISIWFFYSSV
jgi:hypothetical protein